jgi:cobalt-zinc-cadmium resistance protein CzcA
VNSNASQLNVVRQQQLLKSANGFDNPQLEYDIDPYDPMSLSVIVPLRFPSVYAARRGLQKQRIRLSELMLQLNQYDINRLVQNTYNEVQYLYAKIELLKQQDSLYQNIKTAAQRNFDAGQINKLEELFAANEANNIHNELDKALIELPAQKKALSYIINFKDDFVVDSFRANINDPMLLSLADTISNTIRPQILQQQVTISQQELKAERAELLPQLNTGPLFGLENKNDRKQGWRFGISLPLWFNQNRARIKAAQTGIQLAEAQRTREIQDLNRQYAVTISQLLGEQKSLKYYTTIANQQAIDITQTAIRLYQGGQMNYIETIRNIITAFQTKTNYLEAIRNFNQALIELKYLNGSL